MTDSHNHYLTTHYSSHRPTNLLTYLSFWEITTTIVHTLPFSYTLHFTHLFGFLRDHHYHYPPITLLIDPPFYPLIWQKDSHSHCLYHTPTYLPLALAVWTMHSSGLPGLHFSLFRPKFLWIPGQENCKIIWRMMTPCWLALYLILNETKASGNKFIRIEAWNPYFIPLEQCSSTKCLLERGVLNSGDRPTKDCNSSHKIKIKTCTDMVCPRLWLKQPTDLSCTLVNLWDYSEIVIIWPFGCTVPMSFSGLRENLIQKTSSRNGAWYNWDWGSGFSDKIVSSWR